MKERVKIFEVGAKIGFSGNFSAGWRGDFFGRRRGAGATAVGARGEAEEYCG